MKNEKTSPNAKKKQEWNEKEKNKNEKTIHISRKMLISIV